MQLLKQDDPESKKVFWHSSSHVLGQALERKYHCDLCIGPAIAADKGGGFYYDMQPQDKNMYAKNLLPHTHFVSNFSEDDYPVVEALVSKIVSEQQPFERLVVSKEQALKMFAYNKYKVQLIGEKIQDGATSTVYRCGNLIDLCKGPHLPNTSKVKGFCVWKNSSAYWKGMESSFDYFLSFSGNAANDSLQRVYGMSFPTEKEFKAWQAEQEILKERSHKVQGKVHPHPSR